MKNTTSVYIALIGLHVALAFLAYFIDVVSFIYSFLIIITGTIAIIVNKDRNNEALYFAAYFVGFEVFLRMTNGTFLYETGKYAVILFMILGMFYRGINNQAGYYFIYIVLLLPAIVITAQDLGYEYDMRKAIAFNLSGPVCLGIAAMYCSQRTISLERFINILSVLSLPLVSMAVYLFLYTPKNMKEVFINTGSNFATSGGFGPNQVSTVLGLGMFIFVVQLFFNTKNLLRLAINTFLLAVFTYRGIITFSRGGVITAIIIIALFAIMVYHITNQKGRNKIIFTLFIGIFFSFGIWAYSSVQTGGLIENRYKNQDALGRDKESTLSGRETLIKTELQMFYSSPAFGVGVGRNKEIRKDETGIVSASHNELTRVLAEHGTFGIFGLLILIIVPLSLFQFTKENIFLLSFFVFWALTINHAAMRIAAPAFVYALSLLKISFDEKDSLHR